MNEELSFPVRLLQGGLGNLASYLAAHVLLCLLPAFFIAGAMAALIPKEMITRFLGRNVPKYISYPAAVAAGSLLAVCSCTIVPLFAGIYRKGSGIGPAIAFLFFAPAANILALVYTSQIIGVDLAIARFVLSLLFGIGIGLIMALIFRRDDAMRDQAPDTMFGANSADMRGTALAFLLVWVALLLAGTLKLGFLTSAYFQAAIPFAGANDVQVRLDRLVPIDASKGQEGVSVQGLVLIVLLAGVAVGAWRGFERILDGFNRWSWGALGLIAMTLLIAALNIKTAPTGISIGFTGKFFGILVAVGVLAWLGRARLTEDELCAWIWESWRFAKQIFPLLLVGVFAVGVLRVLIRPEWIEALAGRNTWLGNFAGVAFGIFMYFPTLVEVPVARMLLDLGMHRGPLLSYIMADPELSLQSIMVLASIIGKRKAWTYVGWVAVFSVLAGFTYGLWVDGF